MFKILLFFTALTLLNTAAAKQKFYKWTDEQGVTHYTANKPEDKPTAEVGVNTNQPVVNNNSADNAAQDSGEPQKSYAQQRKDKRAEAKKTAKENNQKCLAAKNTIKKFEQQVRMSRVDKKTGETIYLEDNKRASYIKKARQDARKFCK